MACSSYALDHLCRAPQKITDVVHIPSPHHIFKAFPGFAGGRFPLFEAAPSCPLFGYINLR